MEMVQAILPYGLFVLMVGSLIVVKVDSSKKPTFKDVDKTYQRQDVAQQIQKSVDEKLDCIPSIKKTVIQIETKLDILLRNNGH